MATLKKRVAFFDSVEGEEIELSLQLMVKDAAFNTKPSYSTNGIYANNLMPFVDKHMHYLNSHPAINPQHYISNLRLMVRIK